MNANKTNSIKVNVIAFCALLLIMILSIGFIVLQTLNGKIPTPTEKPTTNTPAIDSVTIDKLKACLKLTTTIPVQEHDIIVIPFVGETVGFTAMHSPACKHKSHK